MPDDRVLNPVDVEAAIRQAVSEVVAGVDQYTIRLREYRAAERTFDLAWARAYMNKSGPVEERKQNAVIATEEEKTALDVAEVAFKYVDRRLRAAESTLSAYQTLSKSVMAMYGAAGRGEY
uniref:Head-to-tail adaptor n=2 Tax=unclassified bacterial viruses TaxID=12333 RepID=A0AAU7J7Q9_9VIRU